MNRLLAPSNYLFIGEETRGFWKGKGEGGMRALTTRICHYDLGSLLLQKKACFWLYHVKPSRGFS